MDASAPQIEIIERLGDEESVKTLAVSSAAIGVPFAPGSELLVTNRYSDLPTQFSLRLVGYLTDVEPPVQRP